MYAVQYSESSDVSTPRGETMALNDELRRSSERVLLALRSLLLPPLPVRILRLRCERAGDAPTLVARSISNVVTRRMRHAAAGDVTKLPSSEDDALLHVSVRSSDAHAAASARAGVARRRTGARDGAVDGVARRGSCLRGGEGGGQAREHAGRRRGTRTGAWR